MSSGDERPRSGERPEGPGLPEIDVREWGGKRDGERQVMDRRLFMQLLVFDVPPSGDLPSPSDVQRELAARLTKADVPSVVYADANAPAGIGLLTWSEDPRLFVDVVRPLFHDGVLRCLQQRTDFTMIGRTYSLGHEPDLAHGLLRRPAEHVLHEGWDWAVWYPLRRSGAFEKLEKQEQSTILREHASIGMAYGRGDFAHDVRLACHGLDAGDNEFVIGLVGKDLHPLSHVVQTMRHTRQTSEFIVKMGPFFVGRAVFRNPGAPA
ncbi:MAG: chlorite dismutase family protein [Myxococcota bacterium]|nr:chlorite dismutase family protein [Myxococcota bacterium]